MKSLLPIPTPAAAPARSQRISKHFVKNASERLTNPFFYLETELSLQNQTGWIFHRKLN